MEQGQKFALYLRLEVDEQVAATEQVEPGKGRVLNDVL